MGLLDELKKKNYIENTKGSKYYAETYNANLDFFSMASRISYGKSSALFLEALKENETLALANLLYILDIRGGRGERCLFKDMFRDLCFENVDLARKILFFIPKLGRFDYILVGLNTPIEEDVIYLIKKQLEKDIKSEHPSLLAKWLPSHRTHGKNKSTAKYLMKKLDMNEKDYRKLLSDLRRRLNIVERNLTEKTYDLISFSAVPTKALLKYVHAFHKHMEEPYANS